MSEEFGGDLLTLIDDEGNEHEFEVLDVIENDDGCFYALLPTFEDPQSAVDADGTYYIFEAIEENGEQQLAEVEDEALLDRLAEIFESHFDELYGDEDEDDELGRLCGVVRSADADTAQADPPGVGRGAVPVLAGQTAGLLLREGGRLQVTGLPRHSSLAAGTTVTTLDGQWVGRLAGAPEPDGTGLRETAPLTGTGRSGGVVFVPAG